VWLAGYKVSRALFWVLFPHYLDTTLSTARQLLDKTAASALRSLPFGPVVLVLLQIVQDPTDQRLGHIRQRVWLAGLSLVQVDAPRRAQGWA
jgi:hypothetical protein